MNFLLTSKEILIELICKFLYFNIYIKFIHNNQSASMLIKLIEHNDQLPLNQFSFMLYIKKFWTN